VVIISALVLLALGGVALMPLVANPPPAPREIVVVARGMTFYLDGDATPNPTIKVAPGELVRLTLRNAEAGVSHNFVVRSLGVASTVLDGIGSTSFTLKAPDQPGEHPYICTPHSAMMSGILEVTSPGL
jgi:plastocyanin